MPGTQSFSNDERAIKEGLRVAAPSFFPKNKQRRVLADVYELLEDYAPTWYSARLRGRILTALTAPETKR